MKKYLLIYVIAAALAANVSFANDGPGSNAETSNVSQAAFRSVVDSRISDTIYVEMNPSLDASPTCSSYSNIKVTIVGDGTFSEIARGPAGQYIKIDLPHPMRNAILLMSPENATGEMAPAGQCLYENRVEDSDRNSIDGPAVDGSTAFTLFWDYASMSVQVK